MTSSPTDASLLDDLEFALRLADAADAQSLPRFDAADLEVSTKADHSHVTDADLATERAIRALIADQRPADGILGEEFGADGDTHRQWIIDPIDGTANFLRGVPLWGTMIALAIDGVPRIGVVSMPALGRRWWGLSGVGAWTGSTDAPVPIEVSSVSSLDDASVSFQSIAQWADAGRLPQLLRIADRVWRDRAYGDVYSYMLLAEGRIDMVAEFGVKEYDIAAAVAIVDAAGGRFTAADGSASISDLSALATNGALHDAFVDLLRTPVG
ncbi:inositol monophosphatase family protein [Microbacterium sp.]|uniref:inositol monophosphatase family protein n=1 Tax=Microbacterium sp. TaxID=51671 RepID=UPI0033411984